MKRLVFVLFLLLLVAIPVQAAQLTASFAQLTPSSGVGARIFQMLRIDNSASLTGTGPDGGETAAAGDWSRAVNCAGARSVSLVAKKYGSGTLGVSLWNVMPIFNEGVFSSISAPGVEDPASAPSASDPDPLAVNLTSTVAIDGVADPIQTNIIGAGFGSLIVRVDACTGNCDSLLVVQCNF